MPTVWYSSHARCVCSQLVGFGLFFNSCYAAESGPGALDPSFQTPALTEGAVVLRVLPDGKSLASFYPAKMVRWQPTGEWDSGFLSEPIPGFEIWDLLSQSDGKLLVAGSSTGPATLIRLNNDGSRDTNLPSVLAQDIRSVRLNGEKIILSGSFRSVHGLPRDRVARLEANGELDPGFVPQFSVQTNIPTSLLVMTDGLLGGDSAPALPEIVQGATDLARFEGQSGVLTIVAKSSTLPTYQWQKERLNILGATNSTLAFERLALTDAGKYRVLIRNQVGTLTSPDAVLTVLPAPTIPGAIDLGFDPGQGADGEITAIALQADGRILLAGAFEHFDGHPRRGMVRVLADGQIDPTFNPGSGFLFPSHLRSPTLTTEPLALFTLLTELPDGRIMAGGYFTNFNGVAVPGSIRLHSDGSQDPSYHPSANTPGAVLLQPDGKVITRNPGLRLNSDGTNDPTFHPPPELQGLSDYLVDLTAGIVTRNGDLLIAGAALGSNRGFLEPYDFLVRLREDGTKISGFSAEIANQQVQELPDGRIVSGVDMVGPFAHRGGLVVLHPDGSLDSRFTATNAVEAFTLQPNGKILAATAGVYDSSGVFREPSFARLYPDGHLDSRFNVITNAAAIEAIALQPDGNILVAGTFTNLSGVVRSRVARVFGNELEGPPEILFPPTGGIASTGQRLMLRVLAAGNPAPSYLWFINEQIMPGATNAELVLSSVRPEDAGSYTVKVANGFGSAVSPATVVTVIAAEPPTIVTQPRSQTVPEGDSVEFVVTATHRLPLAYQWLRNGTNLIQQTNAMLVLPNVRLPAAGTYSVVVRTELGTVTSSSAILSITPALVIDPTFDPGLGPEFAYSGGAAQAPSITALAPQSGGKWIIAGDFLRFGGSRRNRIARLTANGTVDPTFDSGVGVTGGPWLTGPSGRSLTSIKSVAVQPDDKVLIGGAFESVGASRFPCLARLNDDGTVDDTFRPTGVAGGPFSPFVGGDSATVWAITLQPDGKILIGGTFTRVADRERRHLARLNSDGTLDLSFDPGNAIMDSGQPNLDSSVEQIVVLRDGDIWVRGLLSEQVGGSWYRRNAARFKPDGTWDTTIPTQSVIRGFEKEVRALAASPDGNLVAGVTTWTDPAGPHRLVSVNTNLALNPSFNSQLSANAPIDLIVPEPNGQILIAGKFTSVADVSRNGLAHLTSGGNLVPTFDPGRGPDNGTGAISAIALRSDGEIAVAGSFKTFDGTERAQVALLESEDPRSARIRVDRVESGKLDLSIRTLRGKSYSLQAAESLNHPAWQVLQSVQGDGTRQLLIQPSDGVLRFYRIEVND